MIIFLYGEDTHRSSKRLKFLKDKYVEKYGDTNLMTYDDNFDIGKIKESMMALPFLAEKRMTIIKNILRAKNKTILEDVGVLLKNLPEETISIFWEETPDKRTALFKLLSKEKSQEFEKLQGFKLIKWIEEQAVEKGGKINSRNAEKLASYVGDDIWQLEKEIDKLIAFKNGGDITGEDIDKMVKARLSSNIFDLVDALGERNYRKSMKHLHELIEQGENEIYILTMIVRQIRNLLLVFDLKTRCDKMQIAKELKLHPFVVQKALSQGNNFSLDELKIIYEGLLKIDIDIKSGKVEPVLALDMFTKEVCSK